MKHLHSSGFLFWATLLVSCSAPMPERVNTGATHRSADNTDPKPDVKLELSKNQETLDGLKKEWIRVHKDHIKLQEINKNFCKRLAEYRTRCAATARLKLSDADQALQCQDNYEDGSKLSQTFTIRSTTPAGKGRFYFVADSDYTSGYFENGTDGKLEWSKGLSKNLRAPKLRELRRLTLKAEDPKAVLPPAKDLNFEVKLNDVVIFNSASIIPSTEAEPKAYSLGFELINESKKSPSCTVSDEELAEIREKSIENVSSIVDNLEDNDFGQLPEGSTTDDTTLLAAIQSAIKEAETKLAEFQLKFDREEDRHGKLNIELNADKNSGCFGELPINAMEIVIKGSHLDMGPVVQESKTRRADDGFPRLLRFDFGEGIKHTHADEETLKIIGGGPLNLSNTFSQFKVKDIEFLKIEKLGVGWESVLNPKCNWLCNSKHESFDIRERNIYQITAIDIKINGQLFYSASGLNQMLKGGSLKWSDMNLSSNLAYRTLMNRTDVCSAK